MVFALNCIFFLFLPLPCSLFNPMTSNPHERLNTIFASQKVNGITNIWEQIGIRSYPKKLFEFYSQKNLFSMKNKLRGESSFDNQEYVLSVLSLRYFVSTILTIFPIWNTQRTNKYYSAFKTSFCFRTSQC